MKLIATLMLAALCSSAQSQDYIAYQQVFNRVDEDVLKQDYQLALGRIDSVYNQHDFIFAKHCIKSLQIACKANDSLRANRYLSKCFRQGVPLWLVRTNELTRQSLRYSTTQQTLRDYDSLHAVYEASFNASIAKEIDSLLEIDQRLTGKVNDGFIIFRYMIHYARWKRNNRLEFERIQQITDQYGFPGERLIGLPPYVQDSALAVKKMIFYGPNVEDYRSYIMLVHYFSNSRKDNNSAFHRNVLNGYMPAGHYGGLNDFMARYGKFKNKHYLYYNVWLQDPDVAHLDEINSRRRSIGLNAFEDAERNKHIQTERRKNKTAYSEIIME